MSNQDFKKNKYIEIQESYSTDKFNILDKQDKIVIGEIEYFPSWDEWVFCPHENTILSWGYLRDIINFLKEKNG